MLNRDLKDYGDMTEPVNLFRAAMGAGVIGGLIYIGVWMAFL